MADRTSAEIFGTLFKLLAENSSEENKRIAHIMFDYTSEYDFNNYQMYADEACIKLGLAKVGIDPNYPEDDECVIFKNEDGF